MGELISWCFWWGRGRRKQEGGRGEGVERKAMPCYAVYSSRLPFQSILSRSLTLNVHPAALYPFQCCIGHSASLFCVALSALRLLLPYPSPLSLQTRTPRRTFSPGRGKEVDDSLQVIRQQPIRAAPMSMTRSKDVHVIVDSDGWIDYRVDGIEGKTDVCRSLRRGLLLDMRKGDVRHSKQ